MKPTLKTAAIVSAAFVAAVPAMANMFGTEITIFDQHSTTRSWEGTGEDQETEPHTIHNQNWDLEGMFLDGTKLTLVGGFDFRDGYDYGGKNYGAGDLFIDIDGDAKFGTAANGASGTGGDVQNRFGYDYVLDLSFSETGHSFNLIKLDDQSWTSRGSDIAASNPWRYLRGGSAVDGYQNVGFSYFEGLTDGDLGLLGGTHYAITLDVSFFSGSDATFHNTMSCGNDNLMGHATVPDSATTVSLFGAALLGLVGFRRFMVKA